MQAAFSHLADYARVEEFELTGAFVAVVLDTRGDSPASLIVIKVCYVDGAGAYS